MIGAWNQGPRAGARGLDSAGNLFQFLRTGRTGTQQPPVIRLQVSQRCPLVRLLPPLHPPLPYASVPTTLTQPPPLFHMPPAALSWPSLHFMTSSAAADRAQHGLAPRGASQPSPHPPARFRKIMRRYAGEFQGGRRHGRGVGLWLTTDGFQEGLYEGEWSKV